MTTPDILSQFPPKLGLSREETAEYNGFKNALV